MRQFALVAAWCLAVAAAPGAAPVKTEQVSFPSGAETVTGYLAAPDSTGKHPALLVLHEDWGLTDWVKEQTRKLAEQGYVALALDFYHGRVAHDPSLAYDLMIAVPPDRAVEEMEAAIHFLIPRPDVEKEKIGVIGWGAGGKWALLLAVNDPFLTACVSNYGVMPTDPAEIAKIHAPVLAIFGADDRYITAGDIQDFQNAMDGAHKSVEIQVYPSAATGFENSTDKLGFRESAAEDAWERTIAFLNQHLR